ncbi:hypothetical protein VDGD_08902 [Verticillium dahliae]|nr:IMP-specific 5'-nucleotidase 1 [Verticillium dahliae VDG1]RBQ83747.1 hypothetical protein VDGD_08902 [Verticillium dahliae]
MPPKAAAAAGDSCPLSANEANFIKVMFDNMKTRPDADWDKVAETLGLANSKGAKERFRQMSKKHNWGAREAGSASPAKPAGKSSTAASPHKPAKVTKTPRKTPAKKKQSTRVDAPEPEDPVLESDREEQSSATLNSDEDGGFEP